MVYEALKLVWLFLPAYFADLYMILAAKIPFLAKLNYPIAKKFQFMRIQNGSSGEFYLEQEQF